MLIVYILFGIVAFGMMVLIHELGHFMMAKANGVKVEEFSIGMGPKLFGVKKGDTEYLIKLLPIGGYVKMLGDEGASTDPRAFNNKKPGQKLSIVAAGPFMNFVLAIVIFSIVITLKGTPVPIISKVVPNSPAAVVGIKPGDKILKVNEQKISIWDDFTTAVYVSKGSSLDIQYERDGKQDMVRVMPMKVEGENRYEVGVYATEVKPSPMQSINMSFKQTGSLVKQTFSFFGTLFQGKATKNDFGGPISIVKISVQAASQGFLTLLFFLGFISVQLAIFNIIPFPALDGGYIVLFLFEMITGKKVDENKVGFINYVGFTILMMLMVLVTIKDILYPLKF